MQDPTRGAEGLHIVGAEGRAPPTAPGLPGDTHRSLWPGCRHPGGHGLGWAGGGLLPRGAPPQRRGAGTPSTGSSLGLAGGRPGAWGRREGSSGGRRGESVPASVCRPAVALRASLRL